MTDPKTVTVQERLHDVAQSDREAAASIVEWQNSTGWEPQFFHPKLPEWMREGVWDEHPVVQAFAAYRTQLNGGRNVG